MRERHPMLLTALALASGALILSACSAPGDGGDTADPGSNEDTASVEPEEGGTVEDDVVTGGDPDEDGAQDADHETYQEAVDCLVEEGAAEEGYTTVLFEQDLYGGFQSGEADPGHPEFTDCLALSGIEFELEN